MSMNFPLGFLSEQEFENLTISICKKILGIGTIGFASGRDGGKDGRFEGTAQLFPSTTEPWSGKIIIQAKHTNSPYDTCSSNAFKNIVKNEIEKIKLLRNSGEIDYYLLFTNRRLTGGTDSALVSQIVSETKIKSAYIIAFETIQQYLIEYNEIAKQYGLIKYLRPLEFTEQDICDVILAFPSAKDIANIKKIETQWDYIPKDEKNELNRLSKEYFDTALVEDIKYFDKIEDFLSDPANSSYKNKYDETIYELRAKIATYGQDYERFELIFDYLSEYIYSKHTAELHDKRRFVRVFLHYMYFTCDIGKKVKNENL